MPDAWRRRERLRGSWWNAWGHPIWRPWFRRAAAAAPRPNSHPTRRDWSRRLANSFRRRRSGRRRYRTSRTPGDGRRGIRVHQGNQGAMGDGCPQQGVEDACHDPASTQGDPAGEPGTAGLPEEAITNPNATGAFRRFATSSSRRSETTSPSIPWIRAGSTLTRAAHRLASEPPEPGGEHRRIRRDQHQRAGTEHRSDDGRERHLLPCRIRLARRLMTASATASASARGLPVTGARRLLLSSRPGANDRGPGAGRRARRRAHSIARPDMRMAAVPAPLAQKP